MKEIKTLGQLKKIIGNREDYEKLNVFFNGTRFHDCNLSFFYHKNIKNELVFTCSLKEI